MPYLLDTNVFIQAKNLHYGFDICPGFWEWLMMANKRGLVFSIEKVREELLAIEDELSEWVRALESGFFLPPDALVIPAFGRISEWVQNQGYEPAAQELFFSVADYYLVAHALAHGFKLVTHEKPADTLRKVKIPNVCIGLGIHHLTPFEMLRRERVRFVLAPSSSFAV